MPFHLTPATAFFVLYQRLRRRTRWVAIVKDAEQRMVWTSGTHETKAAAALAAETRR